MILYPAIDLKDGQCVRLQQGNMKLVTVYDSDPAMRARLFQEQGFEWLHVVDLNGAFEGKSINGPAIESIIAATDNPVQIGGGIRTLSQIEKWLEKGVERVILGTIAVHDPRLVYQACKMFPGKIAVSIDARNGKAAVQGWAETSALKAEELIRRFEGVGVTTVIYTDIERDGVLGGVNWDATLDLARQVSIPVIASGGLASFTDIQRMIQPDTWILNGVISGRAIYDGRIDIKRVLRLLQQVKRKLS